MQPDPYIHEGRDEVRFFVLIDGEPVGASVSTQTLHYCYCRNQRDDLPLETFAAHLADIEAAVRRRVVAGSLKPVLLREFDLRG